MGVTIADISHIVEVVKANGQEAAPINEDKEVADQQAMAIRFISGANYKYKPYKCHLKNQMLEGQDVYPETLSCTDMVDK